MPAPRLTIFSCLLYLLLLRSGPNAPASWWYHAARLVVFLVYLYFLALVVLLCFENRILYHPYRVADQWYPPPQSLQVQDVDLTTADGTHIHGWWSEPAGWRPEQGAVILFHGNAGNVSFSGWQVQGWVQERRQAAFVFDYPGFGKSDGSPTEAGCYAAADAAYDYVTQAQQVPARRVLLCGESLGGAVAIDLASRKPYRALIVSSTFTSFPDIAQETYPMFPGRWLVRNRYLNVEKIRHCPGPIFMGHGTDDRLIPFAQGERLFAAANGPREFMAMPGLGHESPTPEFFVRCMQFLAEAEK
jgi:uncharacterized protein